ncbi:MAG: P-II family nitrogen regulator [Gemmatimonadales bacterium]|nr:P-II family nitrogen regulator [Gemmatimonadales bacterium]
MGLRKVTAIVRSVLLEAVEERLIAVGVRGITVARVKGFGEYADFYRSDWLTEHMRIEIFTTEDRVATVREAIMGAARTGRPGDGIVAVLPVEALYRIRDGENATTSAAGAI